MEDASGLLWVVILSGIWMLITAWGIGANDVANSFGTVVGSKVLTLRQTVIVAAIFEFSGAFLVGSHVTDTIRKGIVEISLYTDEPGVLMLGMLSALIGSAIWLIIASYLKLPVSTTHSIVGGIIGFSLASKGTAGVQWKEVGYIVISWVSSPLLTGLLSFVTFMITRYHCPSKREFTCLGS